MNNPMNNDVIRAEGLGKTYAEGSLHTQVFDGLDIAVAKGETVAILGASGAGKSTLLHLLGGLDVPSAGEVFVDGQKMSTENAGAALAARVKDSPDLQAVISADSSLPYGEVVEVVDMVKLSGVNTFALNIERRSVASK